MEYLILGKRPELWSPVDTIAIAKLIAWSLSGGEDDLQLKILVDALGSQFLEVVLSREVNTPILPRKAMFSPTWLALGSNNRVISPNFMATGKPILANDPRLSLSASPTWIFQRIETPDYTVMGVAFPGAPAVVIGTNGYVAWVLTTGIDVIGYYYYYVWNGTRYYYKGSWLMAERRTETFKICDLNNGCVEKTLEVLETIHGPVVEYGGQRYAMRRLGNNVTLEAVALYRMNRAKNLTEFLEGLRYFVVPSQNTVYADKYGVVAYFASGYFPIRDGGYLPFNGSRDGDGWTRFVWSPSVLNYIRPEQAVLVAFGIGALTAGLAGVLQVVARPPSYSLARNLANVYGLGFDGITAAMLGRGHPIGVLLASAFLGILQEGARHMQIEAGTPLSS